jgi:hypothetical protein
VAKKYLRKNEEFFILEDCWWHQDLPPKF